MTSKKRLGAIPNVPTIAESGVPGFDVSAWDALFAPAGTPKPVVDRLSQALAKVLRDEELRQQLAQRGSEPAPASPEALRQFIHLEIERWGAAIRRSGASLD